MQDKTFRNRVRKILKNKEYIRTTDKENIMNDEIVKESMILLTPIEREVLRLRYIMGFSWIYVSMYMSYSESEVKRIESKAIDKIARVINDLYIPKLYSYIRSGKEFMLHSDQIKERMEKTEKKWKETDLAGRIELIKGYLWGTKEESKDNKAKEHIKKQLRILDSLQGEKLEYFLEIQHRLIMIDAEINVYQRQLVAEGYDEQYKEGICVDYEEDMKPYEKRNTKGKADFLYSCALLDFIEECDEDFINIDKNSLESYKDTPIDIMIQLKKREGKELSKYIKKLEKRNVFYDMMINNTMRNIREAL